jgi:hypothetical protein
MVEFVKIVNNFNSESNIQLNPKKCLMLKIGNDNHTEFIIVDIISHDENIIDSRNNTKIIEGFSIFLKYLGHWEN